MTIPPPTPAGAEPRPPFRRPAAGRPGPRWILFTLVIALALVATGWYVLARPRVVFTNQLVGPIRLVLAEDPALTLAPGETIDRTIPSGKAMVAQWELVRPLSADGKPMGSEVRGSVVVRGTRGTFQRSASARSADADFFAPLITNGTHDQLRIVVNAGLEGSLDCGCAVRPGGRRVYIGYYPLFQNSTVRARTADGRSATFRDLGPKVIPRNGTVGLRFESADLRR